jgi:hypothetical protein
VVKHLQPIFLRKSPFPDESFDVAVANSVLMHLREPVRALAVLRRVLRPDCIAGVREPDLGASLYAPATPLLEQWLAVRVRVRQHNGDEPFLSRHYRRLLLSGAIQLPRPTRASSRTRVATRPPCSTTSCTGPGTRTGATGNSAAGSATRRGPARGASADEVGSKVTLSPATAD